MKLTLKERLFLVNQFKILEALYPGEAYIYERHRTALECGYTLQYDWMTEWFSEELPEAKCREVWDILEMYRSLKFSYDSLADKAEISKEQVRFQGFDGNGESQLMGYVNYIINDLGRYKELSDNDLNAGKPRLELYRKMLSRWAKCKDKSKLSKNDLLKIVSAES